MTRAKSESAAESDTERLVTLLPKRVRSVDPRKLKPHPANYNSGDVERIRRSMRRVGIYRPVYVQKSTQRIIGGHATTQAAIEEGLDRIEVWELDVDDDTAELILAVDNGAALGAKRDDEKLLTLLQRIKGDSDELVGVGFEEADLAALLRRVNGPELSGEPQLGDALNYRLIIYCEGEVHQRKLMERFEAEGLDVKAVMS